MKLHQKILTRYLSSTSPVDKEGYLWKKKERTAAFHRRWFVLKGNLLFYLERPADRHLLGVVVLEGCAVRRADAGAPFAFNLVFGPGLRTYRLAAADRDGLESWVTTLLSASHCYLALLLRDLGRQYEEARQQQGAAAARQPRSFLFPPQGQRSEVREGRSLSAPLAPQPPPAAPPKAKRSPKLWPWRNAYVTPVNGPAPRAGEWPAPALDPLEDFGPLHRHYGLEVAQARHDWLRGRRAERRRGNPELIQLD